MTEDSSHTTARTAAEEAARKLASHPFGVGAFPEQYFDFFNWGAFSQPLLWGIVYGTWSVVIIVLLAQIVPNGIALLMPSGSDESVRITFYLLIIQFLCMAIARIYVGMKANRLLWQRESEVVKRVRKGKSRWTNEFVVSRQFMWRKWGMLAYIIGTGATSYIFYTAFEGTSPAAQLMGAALPLFWLAGTIFCARMIARNAPLSLDGKGLSGHIDAYALESLINYEKEHPFYPPDEQPWCPLIHGRKMPAIGFGTYKITDENEVRTSVLCALRDGYRMIDTANFYHNQEAIGSALKDANVQRDHLFLTSKIWLDEQGYLKTIASVQKALLELETDYLDLVLVHWPVKEKLADTWRALEDLLAAGKIRSIGVANFELEHLRELEKTARIMPMVNQIEMHPGFYRPEILEYCDHHQIIVQAWAPLARGAVFEMPVIQEIAQAHQRSAGQIALRWAYQKRCVVLPKSVHQARIAENINFFDFKLTNEEMAAIDALGSENRMGPDPATFSWDWPQKSSRS